MKVRDPALVVDDRRKDLSTREVARRSVPALVVLAIAIAVGSSTEYVALAVLLGALSGSLGAEYAIVLVERGIVWWDSLGYSGTATDGEGSDDV